MGRNPLIPRRAKNVTTELHKSSGILDDYAVRKNIASREGTIEQTPTDSNHITNKGYVDTQISNLEYYYLKLDGSNANQTIDIATENFENDGFIFESDSDIKVKGATCDIYPNNQTTIGLRIGEDTTNLELSALGASNIDVGDSLYIKSDLLLNTGSITSASGTISFGNENINTTGAVSIGTTDTTYGLNLLNTLGYFNNDTIGEAGFYINSGDLYGSSTVKVYNSDADIGTDRVNLRGQNSQNTEVIVGPGTSSNSASLKITTDWLNFGEIKYNNADELLIVNNTQDRDIYFQVNDGGVLNTLVKLDASSSRVCIKTGGGNPTAKLDVYDLSAGAELDILMLENASTTTNTASTLKFVNSSSAGSNYGSGEICTIRTNSPSSGSADMVFRTTTTGTTISDKLRLVQNGDIWTYGDLLFKSSGAGLSHAEIYCYDASTSQTIATGATYTKVTAFTTNGLSNNCTTDAANDKITITEAGIYRVNLQLNGYIDTANTRFDVALFTGGTIENKIKGYQEFSAANVDGIMTLTGLIDVAASTDIDIRVRHDDGGNVDITIVNANLNVVQIGGT